MSEVITVLLVDDHEIVREGMRSCLQDFKTLRILEAPNSEEALETAREQKPDVVLLDISMPKQNGLETLVKLRHFSPQSRVIICTVHSHKNYVREAHLLGADGYLLKDAAPNEFIEAIETVCSGKRYFSPAVVEHLRSIPMMEGETSLTVIEQDFIRYIAQGLSMGEIAVQLGMSEYQLRGIRKSVAEKTGANDIPHWTRFALAHGFFEESGREN
ncbi:MAG: response regulator [Verrucomicrobiota bacterium]|nr:response regulator [Verrucomicrobiota bacterium]